MCSNSICFPEDIWGELKYLTIPEPSIYFLSSKQVQGYAVPQNYTGRIVSKEALACGTPRGDMLYFPLGETMNIIEYELTRYQLQRTQNKVEQTLLQENMASLEQFGRIDCTCYFGAYPPPNETPLGIVEDFIYVDNGIYFAKCKGEWLLSICEPIADSELTIIGAAFGQKKKDYTFYDTVTCAIPICELRHTYPSVAALVSSEGALYQTLCSHFSVYIMTYNEQEPSDAHKLPTDMAVDTDIAFLVMPQK